MGLDQYLTIETFISGYPNAKMEDKLNYDKIVETLGLTEVASEYAPSVTVSTSIAYWRKANQIHGWFVRNVQGGKDDCNKYYVTREKLEELLDTCKKVLEARNTDLAFQTASDLLPPSNGFFFGSGAIDIGYFEDIQYTVTALTRILKFKSDNLHSFHYLASW